MRGFSNFKPAQDFVRQIHQPATIKKINGAFMSTSQAAQPTVWPVS